MKRVVPYTSECGENTNKCTIEQSRRMEEKAISAHFPGYRGPPESPVLERN